MTYRFGGLMAGIAIMAGVAVMAHARTPGHESAQQKMVRIAEIEVDAAQLDAYKVLLTEEQEASVRLEPGVLMLHSVQIADNPTQIRLLEVYASREAYEAHLQTPHFLKYKNGTLHMVKSLRLVPVEPIKLCGKAIGSPEHPCL